MPPQQPSNNAESAYEALTKAADALHHAARQLRASWPDQKPDALSDTLARNEGLAALAVDAQGKISRWNVGGERLFGYPATEAVGVDYVDLLVPRETQPLTRRVIQTVFRTSKTPPPSRTRLIRKGGAAVTVLSSWSVVDTPAGAELSMVDMDLTDLIRAFEKQRQRADHADGAEKMALIADLVGHLSHHFNNALAIIQGNAELIRRERADDEDLACLVEPILAGARSSAELTGRLRAYTEPASPSRAFADVHAAIRAVGERLKAEAGEGVQIATGLSAPGAVVPADREALESALWELGRNACQAVADGGDVTITTEAAHLDADDCRGYPHDIQPGPYVCVTIRDTGVGMDAQTRRRAFEPFYTTRPFGSGDGLGLATVYGFIRRQRGAITIATEPGSGTEVRMYLPLTRGPGQGRAEAQRRQTAPQPSRAVVLIADDEPAARESLRRILTDGGYEVLVAADGEQAVRCAGGRRVDLAVFDLRLGPWDGPETLRRIQQADGAVKALFSGGFVRAADARAALDCGAGGFLAKPYDPPKVLEAIARIIADDRT